MDWDRLTRTTSLARCTSARRAAAPGRARVCRGAADAGLTHLFRHVGARRQGRRWRRTAVARRRRRTAPPPAGRPPQPPGRPASAPGRSSRRGRSTRRGCGRRRATVRLKRGAQGGRPQRQVGPVCQAPSAARRSRATSKATLSPTWNRSSSSPASCRTWWRTRAVIMMDWDRGMRDDELGQLHVSLEALQHQDSVEFEERLPTQGSLTFSVSWDATGRRRSRPGTLRPPAARRQPGGEGPPGSPTRTSSSSSAARRSSRR